MNYVTGIGIPDEHNKFIVGSGQKISYDDFLKLLSLLMD